MVYVSQESGDGATKGKKEKVVKAQNATEANNKMDGISPTVKTYFDNTYLFELKANIQTIVPREDKNEFDIIVDKTIFHP